MNSKEPDPSPEDIDAVLRFLPLLEEPGFDPGTMRAGTDHADGAVEAPKFVFNPALTEMIDALYAHHWISDFDWSEWEVVAERYVKNPGLLHDAGLGTIRKLFTTHVRMDRFSEGHLGEVARAGHLLAVLRRLKEVRTAMRL